MKKHILIADDDPHIRDVVEFALDSAGFSTATCGNGALALALFQKTPPDLIVLDVGMPEMDGLAVCREIRKTSECPILFLSARDEEVDRILGLEMGGDDYVTKPFSPRELVARTNIILRRTTPKLSTELEDKALRHGMVWLEQASRSARVGDSDLPLTGTEFNILKLLIQRPGFVYSRTDILDHAYAANMHVADRTIDSHMRNLRAKLRAAGCANAIRTVHGLGFQLTACTDEG